MTPNETEFVGETSSRRAASSSGRGHGSASEAEHSLDSARPRLRSNRRISKGDVVRHGTEGEAKLRTRIWRTGPEFDLLNGFLESLSLNVPRGAKVKLFHQPRLESGFPDAVLVVWRPSVTRKWPQERRSLTSFDLRVLHYLSTLGKLPRAELDAAFGLKASESIERLCSAGTVFKRGQYVQPKSLEEIFAVKRIVAIEAKMQDWRGALNQAVLNTWFSDESWLLMPQQVTSRVAGECSTYRGVRCVSPSDVAHDFATHDCTSKPISYASWLFNEWAWRLTEAM